MTYRVAAQASAQITEILSQSEFRYGRHAQANYRMLLRAAMEDVAFDPARLGAKPVPRSVGIWVYDLWYSRNRLPRARRVRNPWHKLLYRPLPNGDVEILAVVGRSYPAGRAAREAARPEESPASDS